ncbi:hypothetical protein XF30_12660 [Bradyrhizobium sp. SUTN9-2]|nr:hypothetical protein XF30_12660 [Bradyrhizobium sp. SUTN9-2]
MRGRVGEARPRRARALARNSVGLDRSVDVLEFFKTQILEREWERLVDLLVDGARDAHAPWLGDFLEPRADIDPISKQISPARYDIPHVNTDPELDTPVSSDLSSHF